MTNQRAAELARWRTQRRRYTYSHEYRDLGPVPGGTWDNPRHRTRLRVISRLLRTLHAAAGKPPSTFMAEAINTHQPYVSNLLSGRRMPTWNVVRALGTLLAELAGADAALIESTLYDMYTAPPPTTESEKK